jgi:hypothetical protein
MKQPGFHPKHPEDYCIAADNKVFLNNHGVQIAPREIAEQFAVERSKWHEAFGFHGFFNFGHVLNDVQLKRFLEIVPNSYLGGLDTYDLVRYLIGQNRMELAKQIIHNIPFKWKMFKCYLRIKIWLMFA